MFFFQVDRLLAPQGDQATNERHTSERFTADMPQLSVTAHIHALFQRAHRAFAANSLSLLSLQLEKACDFLHQWEVCDVGMTPNMPRLKFIEIRSIESREEKMRELENTARMGSIENIESIESRESRECRESRE